MFIDRCFYIIKSNSSNSSIEKAMAAVQETGNLPVPDHLRDAHYKGAAKLGRGNGYLYAHDFPNHYVDQQYLPYELTGTVFYEPSEQGYENKIREHLARIKKEASTPKGGEKK